jgi:hypothetical protein
MKINKTKGAAEKDSNTRAKRVLAVRCSISHDVTRLILATCLCDYFYNLSGGYSEEEREEKDIKYSLELQKLRKREALKIVKKQLRNYGFQGCYYDGFFEGATDVAEQREFWWLNVYKWIDKHYPFLQ